MLPPEPLPPQDAIHIVDMPRTMINPSRRMPRMERLREPTKRIPNIPGRKAA